MANLLCSQTFKKSIPSKSVNPRNVLELSVFASIPCPLCPYSSAWSSFFAFEILALGIPGASLSIAPARPTAGWGVPQLQPLRWLPCEWEQVIKPTQRKAALLDESPPLPEPPHKCRWHLMSSSSPKEIHSGNLHFSCPAKASSSTLPSRTPSSLLPLALGESTESPPLADH